MLLNASDCVLVQCENDSELEFEFPCYNFVETLDGLWDASDPRYHDPDSCYGGVKLKSPPDTFHLIHSIFPRIQVRRLIHLHFMLNFVSELVQLNYVQQNFLSAYHKSYLLITRVLQVL